MLKVSLLGTGNVAHHLFKALQSSEEISLQHWYGRSISNKPKIATSTVFTADLKDLQDSDVYIVAVKDDAISALSEKIEEGNKLLVHTSGSVSIHEIDKKHRRGVFYPLQTFSKDRAVDFSEVPICLEVLEKEDLEVLQKLAEALGCQHYKISTEQRQTLHLSAVFVNNFVNQLYRIGHEISDSKSINFEILKPLILETARKMKDMSPYQAQTGPALRSDKKTIKKHRKMIESPTHLKVYNLLTEAIKKTHGR